MSVRAPVTLRLTTADGAVRDLALTEEMLVVGSGPAAGLHVHDPAVSSLHLLLKRHRDTVLAIDLASEAGTQVGDAAAGGARACSGTRTSSDSGAVPHRLLRPAPAIDPAMPGPARRCRGTSPSSARLDAVRARPGCTMARPWPWARPGSPDAAGRRRGPACRGEQHAERVQDRNMAPGARPCPDRAYAEREYLADVVAGGAHRRGARHVSPTERGQGRCRGEGLSREKLCYQGPGGR